MQSRSCGVKVFVDSRKAAGPPADNRIGGPFAPARFDAVNDAEDECQHPNAHPKQHAQSENYEEECNRSLRGLLRCRSRQRCNHYASNPQNHHEHRDHSTEALIDQRLEGMEGDKAGFTFNKVDDKWSYPPCNDLQNMRQRGRRALVVSRFREVGFFPGRRLPKRVISCPYYRRPQEAMLLRRPRRRQGNAPSFTRGFFPRQQKHPFVVDDEEVVAIRLRGEASAVAGQGFLEAPTRLLVAFVPGFEAAAPHPVIE